MPQRHADAVAARMPAFGCATDPLLTRALEALRANVPTDGAIGLCQGDINIFNYLFRGGPPPSAPFPEPGLDVTDDDLDCEVSIVSS